MIIAIIGTTISPWMQFYIQAAVVDKGVGEAEYPLSRIDVISGALFTDFIAYFIIVASAATIYIHNLHLPGAFTRSSSTTRATSQLALAPLAGSLHRSSLHSACSMPRCSPLPFFRSLPPTTCAKPLASNAESNTDLRTPKYSTVCTLALIILGAGTVIIPGAPLLAIILYSQVLNGVLLPILLVLMLILINNKRLMG